MTMKYEAAAKACAECMTACAHCLDQCIGMPDMAECAKTSRDSMLINAATAQALASDAPTTKHFVQACLEVCRACLQHCEQHEDKHDHCRACAESCRRCIAELEKIAA